MIEAAISSNGFSSAATSAGSLRKRWMAAFVFGELVGFIPPAVIGATLAARDASDLSLVIGLTAAGTLEGAVLGTTQARVITSRWPTVRSTAWISATAAAAGLAWLVGMGGSSLAAAEIVPTGLLLAGFGLAGTSALVSMGLLQWLVLRRAVARSGRWVPVTTAAWLIGVLIPVVSLSVVPASWPPVANAVVAVAAAGTMGLVAGALTGRTLERFAARLPASDDARPRGPDCSAGDHRLGPSSV